MTKGVKDLVIFIKGQEGVYSSLSDDSNNLHLSFQLTHWPLGDFNLILGIPNKAWVMLNVSTLAKW